MKHNHFVSIHICWFPHTKQETLPKSQHRPLKQFRNIHSASVP